MLLLHAKIILQLAQFFILFILAFLLNHSSQAEAQTDTHLYKYGYPKSYERCIEQPISGKTQAEIEHDCARLSFEEKQKEMETKVNKLVSIYEKSNRRSELDKLRTLQNNFMSFLKTYGELHASSFLRTYPYHFYGSRIDLINLRLSHLEIL